MPAKSWRTAAAVTANRQLRERSDERRRSPENDYPNSLKFTTFAGTERLDAITWLRPPLFAS